MTVSDRYTSQVELLLHCFPAISEAPYFALKGGTAINLFYRNMPRISVDIDLVYLPINKRETALSEIQSGITIIAETIRETNNMVQIRFSKNKFFVVSKKAQIKIEINSVVRGSMFAPGESKLCVAAQKKYESFAQIQRLAVAELYGSKFCAALDRQHPRDLFDVMLIQADGIIPDEFRHAFVVYLASCNRPIADILAPKRKDIEDVFVSQFTGMTNQSVRLSELEEARERLMKWAIESLTENERKFLLSIKRGDPDWGQLPYTHINQLPAIQWKLQNIRKMGSRAHNAALARLRDLLEI